VREPEPGNAVEAFREWCGRTPEDPALTPRHPIRRAVTHAAGRGTALEVFHDGPEVMPDTNLI